MVAVHFNRSVSDIIIIVYTSSVLNWKIPLWKRKYVSYCRNERKRQNEYTDKIANGVEDSSVFDAYNQH